MPHLRGLRYSAVQRVTISSRAERRREIRAPGSRWSGRPALLDLLYQRGHVYKVMLRQQVAVDRAHFKHLWDAHAPGWFDGRAAEKHAGIII